MSVETDVRSFLLTQGISGVTSNMIFVGAARKPGQGVPHVAIFVQEQGGLMPNEYMNGQKKTYRRSDFQLRVRGAVGGYQNVKAMADSCWLAMQKAPLTSASFSYVRCYNLQSSPIYVGQDDTEHDEFVVNGRVEYGGGT